MHSWLSSLIMVACTEDKTQVHDTSSLDTVDTDTVVQDTARDTGVPETLLYYPDIQPLVVRACNRCHREGGATFTMEDHSYAVGFSQLISTVLMEGSRPPPVPEGDCRPYTMDGWFLSMEERQRFLLWHEQGAMVGDIADSISTPEYTSLTLEHNLYVSRAFQPNSNNQSRCFVFDLENEEPLGLSQLNVQIDNERIVHHATLFLAPASFVEPSTQDSQSGFNCLDKGESTWTYLLGWTTGTPALSFPENTQYTLPAQSKLILQTFYNNRDQDAQTDRSGIGYTVQTNPNATEIVRHQFSAGNFTIPPNSTQENIVTDIEWESDASDILVVQPRLYWNGIRFSLHKAEECLLEYTRWDFGTVFPVEYREPLAIDRGDSLQMQCSYKNFQNHPISSGTGAEGEMCDLIVYSVAR